MERTCDIFIEFGGHKLSGGFSVHHEKIHLLEESLIAASTHTQNEPGEIFIDAEISLRDISEAAIQKNIKTSPVWSWQ
jgi:single-stranded DNA-specific DHH superfamily exonuclease